MLIQFNSTPLYSHNLQSSNKVCSKPIYKNLSQLSVDTVSFGIGEKQLDKTALTIRNELAKKVVKEAKEDAQELKFILNKFLRPYFSTQKHPNNLIRVTNGEIKTRIKGEDSLRKKVTPRMINTKYGVKNVGDLIGARIVLRDSSAGSVDAVLFSIANAVKQGALRIVEIEKYNPVQGKIPVKNIKKLGYGTNNGLNILENVSGVTSQVGTQKSGYPAIHITVKTKHGYKAEIQIMDENVEDLKHVEDICYKIRCNKGVPSKYKNVEADILPSFNDIKSKGLEDSYMDYVKDSYLTAFRSQAKEFKSKIKPKFLQIPYFLPPKLDFNYIAKKMQECN
ncbi:hypothetical protein J6G99_05275 [bacterium]|nr:hypothetical protein [bacterium]